MKYVIEAIHVGKPGTYRFHSRTISTGFIKKTISRRAWLSRSGLEGDGQADLKNHGGEEKAVLGYALDHYSFWEDKYSRSFPPPAFGENLTIKGLTETEVCIGDVFQLGEAVIEVSQPRNPCYKIAAVHQIKEMPAVVTETGRCGYYFRVLQEGYVAPDDQLELLAKAEKRLSIADIYGAFYHGENSRGSLRLIGEIDAAAAVLKKEARRKLDQLETGLR